jgi:hypothetical protein
MFNQKNGESPWCRRPQASKGRNQVSTLSQPNYSRNIRVGKKIVGKVVENEFVKKVHSVKHFLHKPPAIAFDVGSLEQAQKLGATQVKIIDLDSGIVYKVTIELILEKGFRFNRGYGNQIGLTLNYWQLEGSTQNPQLALWR